MDFWVWVQTVGAVFAGALLAGAFFYGLAAIRRDENQGGDGKRLSARVYFLMAVPLLFLSAVAYSLH